MRGIAADIHVVVDKIEAKIRRRRGTARRRRTIMKIINDEGMLIHIVTVLDYIYPDKKEPQLVERAEREKTISQKLQN